MSRFSKVERRLWGDAKFRALSAPSPNARDLWIYLLTGEHNSSLPGLFVLGVAAMAEALDWPVRATQRCLDEITAAGMARVDPATRLVWLPNALRHNRPESPNVVVGWRGAWGVLPECALRTRAEASLAAQLDGLGESYVRAFAIARGVAPANPSSNPRGNPSPNPRPKDTPKASVDPSVDPSPNRSPNLSPNQEQEPEPEKSPHTPQPPAGAPPATPAEVGAGGDDDEAAVRAVFEHWRAAMGRGHRAALTAKRAGKVRARLGDGYTVAELCRAVDGCKRSPHHQGRNDTGTVYDELELICRDQEHVDMFLRHAPLAPAPATPPPDAAAYAPPRPVPALAALADAGAAPLDDTFTNLPLLRGTHG